MRICLYYDVNVDDVDDEVLLVEDVLVLLLLVEVLDVDVLLVLDDDVFGALYNTLTLLSFTMYTIAYRIIRICFKRLFFGDSSL